MPQRFERSQVILAKKEVTYSVDPVPTGAANAILAANINVTPIQANNVDRALLRPYFGASEQLVGTRTVRVTFDVELVGSGTAGVAPAWAPLVEACAFAETVEEDAYVSYSPVTDDQDAVAIYLNDSGVQHVLLGTRGTFVARLNAGEKPVLAFTFDGLYGPVTAETMPDPVYTAFRTPQVPNNAQTLQLTLGGTLDLATVPEIDGGTQIPSLGLEVDVGNQVPFTPLIGGESVDVTDRSVSARARLDQTAAQEVARMTAILAATTGSVGIRHGTVAGDRVLLWLPKAQPVDPSKEALNGRRLQGYTFRGLPVDGNDEFRIVTSF